MVSGISLKWCSAYLVVWCGMVANLETNNYKHMAVKVSL